MFHPRPDQFISESTQYGSIGHAITSISALEAEHDRFVLTVHRIERAIALKISKNFPRHFSPKTDFLIKAIWSIPRLRTFPMFSDGRLDTIWLQYQLDELYDIRTRLAHGAIYFTESEPELISWSVEQVRNVEKSFKFEGVKYTSRFLANTTYTSKQLSKYLRSLCLILTGDLSWEEEYQSDCEIADNHEKIKELLDLGILSPDPLIKQFIAMRDNLVCET